jgi:hypothetical protein
MIRPLAAIFVFAGSYAFGQSPDSLIPPLSTPETNISREQSELDSVRNSAAAQFGSIKTSYDSAMTAVSEQTKRINNEIDSLRTLNLPGEGLLSKLDSIKRWNDDKINALNEKVEKLKTSVTEKINALQLPPGLEEKGRDLTTMVNELDVSLPDADISSALEDELKLDLPGVENQLGDQSIPGIDNLNLQDANLGEVGGPINQYQDQLSNPPASMEEASSMAEEQAMKISEVNGIGEQLGDAAKVAEMAGSVPDQEAIREELVQKVQQQAVDHFQGKEEQLQKAMETLAKYKQKYSKLEGLDQIPKRRPNEMRDKPFIERLVPGIALQIHRKDAWMVDFNLYAGYRFNPRLAVGAGWNQRVAYDADKYEFNPELRIYGPRLYGQHAIGEGFSARLETEYMNTLVPPQFSSKYADVNGREWVYSTMAGIKKEYRFLGNVKGTMMLLYNLHDRYHRSPYGDKLMVRFGFEFPVKRGRGPGGHHDCSACTIEDK